MKNFKNIVIKVVSTTLVAGLFIFISSFEIETKNNNQLQGSWHLKEVNWISSDTTHVLKKDKLGLLLFTEDSYSIMWSPTEKPRAPFQKLSNPTDEEILKGFKSIVFNAGVYTKTDSTLNTTSIIAKVPGFEGGKQFYTYAFDANQLTLTMHDETYPNGEKPSWSGTWQTKFFFTKTILE